MKNNIKSTVMKTAWELVKSAGLSLSDALRKAWRKVKKELLKLYLRSGKVEITFQKVNGEVTTRTGTVNFNLMPAGQHPKGNGGSSETLINFYSLTDNGWRSLRAENLISFKTL